MNFGIYSVKRRRKKTLKLLHCSINLKQQEILAIEKAPDESTKLFNMEKIRRILINLIGDSTSSIALYRLICEN